MKEKKKLHQYLLHGLIKQKKEKNQKKMVLNKLNLPKAYKEVIKVIEYLPEELYVKIPEEILENLYENMDKDYEFEITNSKTVKFLKETEDILAVIYRDYLASENEKRKIELLERQEETELEEEKRKNIHQIIYLKKELMNMKKLVLFFQL